MPCSDQNLLLHEGPVATSGGGTKALVCLWWHRPDATADGEIVLNLSMNKERDC
jgi:hypothetical protein